MNEEILKIISARLQIPSENIEENSIFTTDMGADSLDMLEIVMAVEDKFNISISDDDIALIRCPKDLHNLVFATE